jgi:hypothetical protein
MEEHNKKSKSSRTGARDKSVKIRIISKRGNTREQTRRELMGLAISEFFRKKRWVTY